VLESGRYAFWFQGCGNEPFQERLLVNGNVLIFGGNIYYFQRYTGDEASASSVKNMGWTIPAEATLVSTGTVTEPWVFDIEANVEITANVTKGTNGYASLYIYKVE